MKRILTLVFTSICILSYAQDGINYQGAATDSNGDALVNQSISLKTSILSGTATGTIVFSETHSTTTDQFGLFNVVIGQGNSISGVFDDIDWGAQNHFLQVELDENGGSNYTMIATTQMMSVPYALYAKNAGNANSNLTVNTVSQYGDTLYLTDGNFLIIPGLSQSNLHYHFHNYGTVTDADGNIYKTLEYGNNEWMIENLKTAIGSYVTPFTNSGGTFAGYADSVGYYYSASDVVSNVCPAGWHVATIQDWQNLHYEIYGTNMNPNGYTNSSNGYDDNNYKILWSTHEGGTNQSAFNLFRTGYWVNSASYITSEDFQAGFWSSSGCSGGNLYKINLYSDGYGNDFWSLDVGCTSAGNVKAQVRCVKD